jgi:hypothetical protein
VGEPCNVMWFCVLCSWSQLPVYLVLYSTGHVVVCAFTRA